MSPYHSVYVLITDSEFSKRFKCQYWMIGLIRFVFSLNCIASNKIEEKYQGVNLTTISVPHTGVMHHSVCISSCPLKCGSTASTTRPKSELCFAATSSVTLRTLPSFSEPCLPPQQNDIVDNTYLRRWSWGFKLSESSLWKG